MVSDPQLATPHEAYELLRIAVGEHFGHLERGPAIRHLAGDKPAPEGWDRFGVRPWPALEAHVQTHDKEGQEIAAAAGLGPSTCTHPQPGPALGTQFTVASAPSTSSSAGCGLGSSRTCGISVQRQATPAATSAHTPP